MVLNIRWPFQISNLQSGDDITLPIKNYLKPTKVLNAYLDTKYPCLKVEQYYNEEFLLLETLEPKLRDILSKKRKKYKKHLAKRKTFLTQNGVPYRFNPLTFLARYKEQCLAESTL